MLGALAKLQVKGKPVDYPTVAKAAIEAQKAKTAKEKPLDVAGLAEQLAAAKSELAGELGKVKEQLAQEPAKAHAQAWAHHQATIAAGIETEKEKFPATILFNAHKPGVGQDGKPRNSLVVQRQVEAFAKDKTVLSAADAAALVENEILGDLKKLVDGNGWLREKLFATPPPPAPRIPGGKREPASKPAAETKPAEGAAPPKTTVTVTSHERAAPISKKTNGAKHLDGFRQFRIDQLRQAGNEEAAKELERERDAGR